MEDNKNEMWRDVVGYEGYYIISNIGMLKSVDRWVCCNSVTRLVRGQVMNTWECKKGYLHCRLSKGNRRQRRSIHRMVAEAFLPNPENKATVNHINGIKTDNRVCNLEWHTVEENLAHARETGLRKHAYSCKKVYDECTQKLYNSIVEAAYALGISYDTCRRWTKKGHSLHFMV